MNTVVQILDSLADAARTERTDGQLIDLFVRLRDEEGFAAIVRRHGPMVRGVCGRVLRNPADADDAFQAAFLVLARKAATIGTRHRLAQWLYGVAYNTARKLREANTRRAKRECPLASVPEPSAVPAGTRDEWLAILDDELSGLSERYREVIVLCDLEGLTRREAAKALGCPEGTVAGRLARARQLLAARLTCRGVVPVAAVLALLTERGATAVPPTIFANVIRAVSIDGLAHAAASGLISRRVADTTEGVLKAMFTSKLRAIASAAIYGGLALTCCIGAFHFASAQPAPEPTFALANAGDKPGPEKPPAKPADESLTKTLTVFPLKKLDPDATAKVISGAYQGKGVTVTVLPTDRALLVYASEPLTLEIGNLLLKLGESAPKKPSVIRLKAGSKTEDVARGWAKAYPDATFVPVADEGVVLVYADHLTTKQIRVFDSTRQKLGDGPGKMGEKTLSIHFDNAAWMNVLNWYSDETGLAWSPTVVTPTGSVTIKPGKDRRFTIAEVTDLINEALVQQKFILIRREMGFTLHSASEKLHRSDFVRVTLPELTGRGRTELVNVSITLKEPNSKEVETEAVKREVSKLLSPFGEIVFAKGGTCVIRDMAGNVCRILEALEAYDKPAQPKPNAEPIDPRKPEKTYPIKFEKVAWKDVFTWYESESGLTRSDSTDLSGVVTLTPPAGKKFTLTELTDLINDALLMEKHLLIRRQATFVIVPADKRVDPTLIPNITVEELPKRGRTELVQVTFPMKEVAAKGAATVRDQLKKTLSPFGRSMLTGRNELIVTDLAGNLVKIKATIDALSAEKK